MTLYVLADDGETAVEATIATWLVWAAAHPDRRIATATINGSIEVSTAFVGLNVWGIVRPRGLWETMVFGGPLNGLCVRYDSHADALGGHRQIVVRCAEVELATENDETGGAP